MAIKNFWPEVSHQWCKWHLLKKGKESLGYHYMKKSEFRTECHKLVGDMLIVEEFEKGWQDLWKKYSLQTNTFLIQIYKVRCKWAKHILHPEE